MSQLCTIQYVHLYATIQRIHPNYSFFVSVPEVSARQGVCFEARFVTLREVFMRPLRPTTHEYDVRWVYLPE